MATLADLNLPQTENMIDANGKVTRRWRGFFEALLGQGGGMVYPGAGIALSDGSMWLTSIANNSAKWNAAVTGGITLPGQSLYDLMYASIAAPNGQWARIPNTGTTGFFLKGVVGGPPIWAPIPSSMVYPGAYGGPTPSPPAQVDPQTPVAAGIGIPAINAAGSAWATTFQDRHPYWNNNLYGIFNVLDYGALPDGTNTATTTAAFLAAIAAAKAFQTAAPRNQPGTIYAPAGSYSLNQQLDLTSLANSSAITLIGAGKWQTQLHFSVFATPAPAILCGNSGPTPGGPNNAATRIAHIGVFGAFTLPSVQVANEHGIASTTYGSGASLIIDDVDVGYFRNHSILIQGPAGPVVVRDATIYECAGYGLCVAPGLGGDYPSDVRIAGGSIQNTWGGIGLISVSGRFLATAVDIELGNAARLPCAYIGFSCQGASFNSCTMSAGGSPAPGAIVYCEGAGATFNGCVTQVSAGASTMHNFWFNTANCSGCAVIGGYHSNVAGAGYFAIVDTGVRKVTFVAPAVNTGTYTAPQGNVLPVDGTLNEVNCFGVALIGFSTTTQSMVGEVAITNAYTAGALAPTGSFAIQTPAGILNVLTG